MTKTTLCFIGLFLLTGTALADADNGITERYIALALQGDLSSAPALFSGQQAQNPTAGSMELSRQFRSRFVDRDDEASPGTGDAFADSVIDTYRTYWNRALTGEISEEQAGIHLGEALKQLLAGQDESAGPISADEIYPRLGRALRQGGFHVLHADAPPLKDLIVWKSEEVRKFSVRLTDGTENVDVVFLSDTFSMGWKDYATFGLAFTTGWVEDGRLYCVDWAYNRNSEKFEVSYLKHESRHLADFRNFPALSSADLEYRAKLTELAFSSKTTMQLLADFTRKSARNPEAPHAYANYRVTRDVYREVENAPMPDSADPWSQINSARVNRAARTLLEADTRRLQSGSP
jgi:hypothetical protein